MNQKTDDPLARTRLALKEALRLLSIFDADANNQQLDIQRFRRKHHLAVREAEAE